LVRQQDQGPGGTAFDALRIAVAQIAVDQFVFKGKQGAERAVVGRFCLIVPVKGSAQPGVVLFIQRFQAVHIFALTAENRLVGIVPQITQADLDGGGLVLNRSGMD